MSGLTTLPAVKAYLGIAGSDQDDAIAALIETASDAIERYCNRRFSASDVHEWIDAYGNGVIQVSRYPINSIAFISTRPEIAAWVSYTGSAPITSMRVDDTSLTLCEVVSGAPVLHEFAFADYPVIDVLVTAIPSIADGWAAISQSGYGQHPTAYLRPAYITMCQGQRHALEVAGAAAPSLDVDYAAGQIFLPENIIGKNVIFVAYNGGYESIPDTLMMMCNQLVQYWWNLGRVNTAAADDRLADRSYTVVASPHEIPESLQRMLAMWRRYVG